MIKPYIFFLHILGLIISIPQWGSAQVRISENEADVLLLNMSSGYLNVVRQAAIDIDSTLILASQRNNLSLIPVMTEGFDKNYPKENYRWMDSRNPYPIVKTLMNLKGKEHARLLLLLGTYYAFRPGKSQSTDMAVKYLLQARSECKSLNLKDWVAQSDILMGKCYLKSDISAAKSAFQSAINYGLETKKLVIIAKAYNYQGIYCPFIPSLFLFRKDCMEKAAKLFNEINDRENEANMVMDISYMSFAVGKFKESEIAAYKSLGIQKSLDFPHTHYTNDMLAFLSRIKYDYSSELRFALEAVKTAEATKDSLGFPTFYNRVADSYYLAGNHIDESNAWNMKSLKASLKDGGNRTFYILFTNYKFIAYALGKDGSLLQKFQQLIRSFPPTNTIEEENAYIALSACYQKLNKFSAAEKYLLMAKKLDEKNKGNIGNITNGFIYFRLGDLYVMMKDHKKNRFYTSKYLATTKDSSFLIGSYWNLYQADSALGNFSKMKNLYMYANLKDKAYTKTKNRLVEELNVRYNTMQKQKDLEVYKAKNLLQLQQAATTRHFTVAGLLILVLIILMIWAGYNRKKKINLQLQRQKNEISTKNTMLNHVINEKDELLVSKEWLLKEVHHRVKNNLQMVMSLLNSQTSYLKDEQALNAVMESHHRVQAMSLIHQKLYKSDNVSRINMKDYITDLVASLKDSFKTKSKILFDLQIESMDLDVSQAIPLGLILNELITNAIKYAFPFTKEDKITINFSKSFNSEISLKFIDNGCGLPAGFNESKNNSFGITLMKGLTEELDGEFNIDSKNGTSVTISFKQFYFLSSIT